jgi:HlyD family secretion protein
LADHEGSASRRRRILLAVFMVGAVAAGSALWLGQHNREAAVLTLYGNVDIREVQLAFNDSDRVARLLVQEGDAVQPRQLLAELDERRFAAAAEQARGEVDAQQQVLARLLAGSRPEEIAQAKATMEALEATLRNAQIAYRRAADLRRRHVVAEQDLDDAQARLDAARGNYEAARQAWILAVKGPREEDIANAREVLKATQAALEFAEHQLADTKLYAPSAGVIEDRILEPGDMASPGVPVFTMALTDPVWVRAYVPEPHLGKIKMGMRADITTDSFPGKAYRGWIGYISPTAEFTPKTVETTDLRTRLVYQVRVFACNAQNELRLGMPATVAIRLDQPAAPPASEAVSPCAEPSR